MMRPLTSAPKFQPASLQSASSKHADHLAPPGFCSSAEVPAQFSSLVPEFPFTCGTHPWSTPSQAWLALAPIRGEGRGRSKTLWLMQMPSYLQLEILLGHHTRVATWDSAKM